MCLQLENVIGIFSNFILQTFSNFMTENQMLKIIEALAT